MNQCPPIITELRSSSTWITPCKRSAARGHNNPHSPELRRSSTKSERDVELLRSSVGCGASYPELRFAHSGLSISNSFGVSARMTSLLVVWTKGVRFLTTFGMTSTSVLWTNGAAATPPLLSPPHRRPVIAGLTRNPLKNKGIPAFAGMTAL